MALSPSQQQAMQLVVTGTLEAIHAGERPHSATPAGVLYAAMMQHGASHSQFTSLMGALMRAGMVAPEWDDPREQGEIVGYRLTDAGRARIGVRRAA